MRQKCESFPKIAEISAFLSTHLHSLRKSTFCILSYKNKRIKWFFVSCRFFIGLGNKAASNTKFWESCLKHVPQRFIIYIYINIYVYILYIYIYIYIYIYL